MDEPTNDLDIETLDLLEDLLVEYKGTLLLVSHDRDFLDNVVTSSMVFEGDGRIEEYVGGYSDWVKEKEKQAKTAELKASVTAAKAPAAKGGAQAPAAAPAAKTRKLTNKEVKELEGLPAQIERLEREQAELAGKLSDASFYHKDRHAVGVAEARLAEIEREHATAFARWEELEAAKNG
ncbi:MAG: hypothetical protein QM760_19945 [Nibricoccus sp.]